MTGSRDIQNGWILPGQPSYLPVHMAERGESIFMKTAVRASSLADVLMFHARGVILCFDYAVTAVTCNVR